ncbi:MAG: sel1 repeat family protein [Bacteroidales bacterium]|nr:sel1 repeat family protein [Bacteroidales bacterium]
MKKRKINALIIVALALLMVSCSHNNEEKTSEEHQKVDLTRTSIDAEDSLRQVPDSLIVQAENNNAEAQFLLGRHCWFLGDTINCLKWMKMAESNGEEMATVFLLGYNNDYKRALPILVRLVNGRVPTAQSYLGWCYEFGKGVKQSYEKAVEWYSKAAEQGDASAQYLLGLCYEYGKGIKQSYEKAVEWYSKAAKQGDMSAQYLLGLCYEYGKGVKQSYEKAVEWCSKAAEQGKAPMYYWLGRCFNAAEQGNAYAQRCLGYCYYRGEGVEQSFEKAVEWYTKAAEQGDALAQSSLGDCYYYGEGVKRWRKGLKYSYKKAVEWYSKAAKQGCVNAKFQLGRCYQYGFGVNKDKLVALNYYVQASILGDKEAENRISKLIDGELARKMLWAYDEERDLGLISVEECEKRKDCIRKYYSEDEFFNNINTSHKNNDKYLITLGLMNMLGLIGLIIVTVKIYESHKHL